jgi:hypothetical protein
MMNSDTRIAGMIMPNGKALRNCTFREVGQLAKRLTQAEKVIMPNGKALRDSSAQAEQGAG